MITKENLIRRFFGKEEKLFDVGFVLGNIRYRMLWYLRKNTEEENKNDPELYLRFTDNKRAFKLEKITLITEKNLHLYEKYDIGIPID